MSFENRKKMKRVLGLALAVLMVLTMAPPAAFAAEGDAYLPYAQPAQEAAALAATEMLAPLQTGIVHPVNNANFEQFLSGVLGGQSDTFRLTENISFPAGSLATGGRPGVFAGTFDGDGHTIFDLRFVQGGANIGLFQSVGGGAVIEDVTLANAAFNSNGSGGWATAVNGFGFIAGNAAAGTGAATIRNVTVVNAGITIGTAAHTNTRLGGLVGRVDTGATLNIESVTVGSTLQTNAGTTAGATGNFAGGLVGQNNGNLNVGRAPNEGDRNTVNVPITHTGTARFARAGGVVGDTTGGNIVIEHTDVLGAVNAGAHAGGVVGHTAGAGSVTIRDTVVGPAPPAARIEIRTNAAGDVGGMIGLAANLTHLERVTNHATIHAQTGAANLGGLIGRAAGRLDIRNGTNTGNINHQPAAIQRSGGLVGWSTNRIEINGGFNSGNLTSPGTNRDAANRMGGIVGQATHAAAAANRRIIIHNVENTGNIIRPVHTAGGIVGHITGGGASDITQVTNAINRGAVPTRQNGGGIVGWVATSGTLIGGLRAGAFLPGGTVALNAAQAAEQTRGSLNYGAVSTSLDEQGSTAGRRNASIGGIVGNNTGTSTNIHQAGNYGRVLGQHRTTGSLASSRGGSGGIIGRQAGGSALIQQVFNMGHISSNTGTRTDSSRMVGGIIGHQRAGGILEDFYSVGPVTSTGGNRRASGIIGMRTSGTMTVRRGYVATRIGANDLMLGTSGTTGANPAVSGMSFTQVYVLNTIGPPTGAGGVSGGTDANRNILQNHRGGILVGSDMLAMGVLPGISGGPWRSGIVDIGGTAVDLVEGQSSLPYFAWQTAHTESGLQERFFYQITGDHLFAPTAATGSSSISFSGVRYPEATRVFDPRNHTPAASSATTVGRPLVSGPAGSVTVGHHNVLGTSATPNGRLTWGLISPDGVIGFGAAADSDLFIVQAIDADCPERSPIAHAQFTAQAGMEIALSTDGILIVRIGTVVPGNWISATALGFHPSGNVTITDGDIGIGSMEIEMRRAPINRAINVFVRDGSAEVGEDDPQPNLFHGTGAGNVGAAQANSTRFVHVERLVPGAGTAPGAAPWTPEWASQYTYRTSEGGAIGAGERAVVGVQGNATRLAQIPAGEAMVGQAMRAGSAGFDWEEFAFCISMIDEITTGTGPLVMTIDLADVRLASPVPVRVVEHTVDEVTGDDIFTNIPGATLTAVHGEGRIPPLGALGVTGTNPFQLSNATMYTVLTADATGFILREVLAGDYYEPYQPAEDGEPAVPAGIMIVLEPEIIFDVLIVEEVVINGVPVQRPIGGSYLHLNGAALPGSGEPDNAGLFLDVITYAGDTIVASADGFYYIENAHVVAREDHGRTMASEDGPVVITLVRETPPPGAIRGFVWDAYTGMDTIPNAAVVLMRQTADGWELADNTTTNAFGFYTFTNVATPGTYRVMASHANFVTNTAEMDPIELGLSQGVLADVYLERRDPEDPPQDHILLVDVISGATGQPLAAADTAVTFNGTTMTHDGETWRLTLPAATAGDVRVAADGYRLGVATVAADSFAHNFRFVRVILIPLPDLPPLHGGIHGFVTNDETNGAIPGASVVITNAVTGAVVFNGLTDAEGRYQALPLPVGSYNVVVSRNGFAPQARQVTVTDGEMTRADFALVPDTDTEPYEYTLQVVVAVNPAAPIPAGAEVLIIGGQTLTRVGTSNVWIIHTDDPLTGERAAAGAPLHHSDDALVGAYANRIATVELTLRPHTLEPGMGGIRGTVTAAAGGAPVAGATVAISNAAGVVYTTTTDAFGRYVAPDLAPGSYTVTVVRNGFVTQSRTTTVAADQWTTENFALAAGGQPGNYTVLAIVTGASADAVTVTTADATFTRIPNTNLWETRTIAQLPAAQLVHAGADGYRPASAAIGTYTNGVAQVTLALGDLPGLDPGMGGIYGTVTGPAGPIHNATVMITNAAGIVVRTVVTDAEGFYTAANLTPGAYTVTVVAGNHGTVSRQNVPVTANTWREENFTLIAQPGNYVLIATVTGPSADAVTVTTAGAAFTRIPNTNLWEARTETALPAAQLVHASAGGTHHPGSAEVGPYTHNVAHAAIVLAPVEIRPGQYAVVFHMNDGTNAVHHTAVVDTGRTVNPPANPVRTGYTFLGWYTEEDTTIRFNFGTPITAGLDLYARWQAGGPGETHIARFHRNDGTGNLHYVAFVPAGTQLTAPAVPTRGGFTFEYWSLTASDFIRLGAFDLPAAIDSDVDLHVRWRIGHGDTHTVVFRMNDGTYTIHHTAIVDHGRTVTPPTNPTRAGHTFLGWEREDTGALFNFGTLITGDLVLNARWQAGGPGVTHTVQFWRNDGGAPTLHYAAFVPDGQPISVAPANPVRVGFTFQHWSGSAAAPTPIFSIPTLPITTNLDVHAHWELGGGEGHTVVFWRNDGTPVEHYATEVDHGSTVNPPANPVRAGYTFLGWYTDEDTTTRFNFATLITGNLELFARWREGGPGETHIARFWRNDGTGNLHYVAFVPAGEQLTAPTVPTRGGFTFEYWSLTASDFIRLGAFDLPAAIDSDVELHVRWRIGSGDTHTVVFRRNDGSYGIHHTAIVDTGSTVTPPANPTRAGHTFLGWEREDTGALFNFGTLIDNDLVLNARWEVGGPGVTHTVLFWRNDVANNLHYAAFVPTGGTLAAPTPNPLRSGFLFQYWSDAPEGEEFDNWPVTVTGDRAFHGIWQAYTGHRVNFRMNDGTDAIHAFVFVEDGRTVSPPAVPARTGYTFRGWYTDPETLATQRFNFGTPITENLELHAGWDTGDHGPVHTVSFWRNDGSGNLHDALFVRNSARVPVPADPVRAGWTFTGWHTAATEGALFNFNTAITENMDLHASWFDDATPGYYAVVFRLNDGTNGIHAVEIVAAGRTVAPPTVPTRDGHTFRNWYTTAAATTAFNFGTVITGNLQLHAGWDAGDHGPVHTVSFHRNDGSGNLHHVAFVRNNAQASAPAEPVRESHTFTAWHTNTAGTAPFVFTTPITADLDLYADWTTEGTNRVRFWSDGDLLHTAYVAPGRTVSPPANPTCTGYTFTGWFTDAAATQAFNFGTVITGNLELYAGWRSGGPGETHAVRFYRNDGSGNLHQVLFVEDGARVTPPADPARADHTFLGWHTAATEGTLFNFNTAITEDRSLHAAWFDDATPGYYAVVFRMNDGTDVIHATEIIAAGRTVAPPAVPTRDGYTFRNWYTTAAATTAFNFGTVITGNLQLHAGWDAGDHGPVHTVSFHRNDGSGNLHYVAFVRNDARTPVPADPVRADHTFLGWHTAATEGTLFNFNTAITEDRSLHASWFDDATPGYYAVVFRLNDGTNAIHAVEIVAAGRTVSPPAVPTRDGYTFRNWYTDAAAEGTQRFSFGAAITGNRELFAGWTEGDPAGPVLTVLFHRNDGTADLHYAAFVVYGNTVALPVEPERKMENEFSFEFADWSLDVDGREPFNFDEPVTEDLSLYAYWYIDWDRHDPIHHAYLIGDGDGLIRPRANITRAEVATIFFRLYSDAFRYEHWSQENEFTDVSSADWFNNAVSTTANAGTFQGRENGDGVVFAPHDTMNRAEFAAVLAREFELDLDAHTGDDLFTDIGDSWARRYINAVGAEGWMIGPYGIGGVFNPEQPIQRAEVATALNRMLDRQPENAGDLLAGMRTWSDNANENAWYFLAIQEATNSHTHEMKDCGIYEYWAELLPPRNWAVLERPDSNPWDILEN